MVHYKLEATNKAREIGEIHENMLKLAWIILANIGLWAHYFKYRKWALPLHKAVMLILTLVTWLAIFAAIVLFGIDNDKISDLHVVIGLVIMVLSAIASSGGILCSIL
jgi:hypothetical protein